MSKIKLGPGMALASLRNLFTENEIEEMYSGKRIGTIDIEITDLCNFQCGYCYASCTPKGNKNTKREEVLTTEKVKNLIDQASDLDIRLFNIQGGEPTLDMKRFFEIAEYARPKFKALVGFTNGTLFSEEDIKKVSALDMSLCVKLDTLQPDIYEKLTGVSKIYLDKVLKNLDLI